MTQNFPDTDTENSSVVFAAVADGSGGWYIGGSFSRIGDVSRNGLARLKSDGSLDTEFAPPLPRYAGVGSIVRHGNVVYVGGGEFGAGIPNGVAAFDARSGKKLWQVSTGKEGLVGIDALAFASGTLFVGGAFTKVAGVPRDGIAALDPRTGKPTPWNVRLISGDGKSVAGVNQMSSSNGVIYFTGWFGLVNGVKRNLSIAAVSARTGQVTAWNPQPSSNEPSYFIGILATHGQVLVGGKDGFASYDARTGRVLPWPEHLEYGATVFAASGNTVYLGELYDGGLFSVSGKRVRNLAAIVLPSGRGTNWRPMLSPAPEVRAVAVSGQNVLVAG